MILAALLLAAAPQTAVDAERAFAADAQTMGQWTAFRKWAALDAIMFVPQPQNAHEFLKGLPDPKLTYQWWPAQAFVSCDGKTAVTTGPAVRGGYRGYFTTVWRRQPDGRWRWLLDHGDAVSEPRLAREQPIVRRASCRRAPTREAGGEQRGFREGMSDDRSLVWRWTVHENGARMIWAELWDGAAYRMVLEDKVAAPKP